MYYTLELMIESICIFPLIVAVLSVLHSINVIILLFGKIHTGLYSKLSANYTWVAVIEYLERKPFF